MTPTYSIFSCPCEGSLAANGDWVLPRRPQAGNSPGGVSPPASLYAQGRFPMARRRANAVRRRLGKPSHPRKAVLPRAKTPAKPVSGSCPYYTIKASRPSVCYQNGKRNASAKTANAVFIPICVYYTTILEPTGMFRGLALPNTGHTLRPMNETPPIIEDDCMFTLCMNIVPQILNEPGSFTVWLCQTPAVPSGR